LAYGRNYARKTPTSWARVALGRLSRARGLRPSSQFPVPSHRQSAS